MAFSMFLRGVTSKINVSSCLLQTGNVSQFRTCALRSASSFAVIKPMKPIVSNVLDKSKAQQYVPVRLGYSTEAPKTGKVTLWIAERLISASMLATLPLALIFPSRPLDVILAVSLVAHTYWGFEAIVTEYVRPLLFGNLIPKILHVVVAVAMMLTLGGLFYIIFDDIGLAATIKRLWAIKPKNQST